MQIGTKRRAPEQNTQMMSPESNSILAEEEIEENSTTELFDEAVNVQIQSYAEDLVNELKNISNEEEAQ